MGHDAGDRELADKLTKAFTDLDATLKAELKKSASTTSTNTQTIRFDVGGVAIWLSLTCCIVTVFLVIVAGFFYVDQMRRVDKMQDYLNAIYLQAPSLRPKT